MADNEQEKLVAPQAAPRKYDIVYKNVVLYLYGHVAALYGLYLCFTAVKWATVLFCCVCVMISALGITAGAHRLWTHRTYKAKLPLEILLMLCNCMSMQDSATTWVRDHRLHHKHCDTDADPYNAARGFFFSHVGWLLVRKHPLVKQRGRLVDMSDIYDNPVLRFQKKYAMPLLLGICLVIPTIIPVWWWGDSLFNAWHVTIWRYVYSLNGTFLVNSAAHKWGSRPFDRRILPAENRFVSFISLGEGFHNYHHVFPWDYRTAELGNNYLNWTTKVIDFFAWIGWAYDLKTAPSKLVEERTLRTGHDTNIWGLDDKDLTNDIRKAVLKDNVTN